jgi:putative ABC transport system substrate-binding protein
MALPAVAQQREQVWRVGFFYFASRQSSLASGRYNAFVQGMRELGYVEGKNLVIEARFGDSDAERLPGLAAELVRSKVDVIVATGSPVYRALRQVNTTIPVVVTVTADPMIEGLAASLARPGGNFTGLSDTATVLGPKHLELLMSVAPRLTRIGVLLNPDNGSHQVQLQGVRLAAQKVGVRVVTSSAAAVADLESGFVSLAREHADALMMFGDTFFTQQLQQIAETAARRRMPSIYLPREYAQAGGLMSYGPDFVDNFRRAATYVDKILKGTKPGELSFQQPTKYLLAINLRTARALGLTVPQTLLLRADEVID